MAYGLSIRNRIEIFAESMGIDEEEFERQCGLPEDAIAGRAGILCAGACGGGVCGPERLSYGANESGSRAGASVPERLEPSLLNGASAE